jgi:hypothetical protein
MDEADEYGADGGINEAYRSSMISTYGAVEAFDKQDEDPGLGLLEARYSTSGSPSKNGLRTQATSTRCKILAGLISLVILPLMMYIVIRVSDIENLWIFQTKGGELSSALIYPSNGNGGKPIRLMLVGDQLISWPIEQYKLEDLVKAMLPGMPLEVSTHAHEGQQMSDIRYDIDVWLGLDRPDAVIAFVDSDITDIDITDSYYDEWEAQWRYEMYEDDLHKVLGRAALNSKHLALAGPGVIGDGPLFLPTHLFGKQRIGEIYKKANEKYTSKYENTEYIDLEKKMRAAVPWWYPLSWGFVTVDGERVNRRGAYIEAEIIAMKLRQWFWPESLGIDNDDWVKFDELIDKDYKAAQNLEDAKINQKIIDKEIMEPFLDEVSENKDADESKKLVTIDKDDDSIDSLKILEGFDVE